MGESVCRAVDGLLPTVIQATTYRVIMSARAFVKKRRFRRRFCYFMLMALWVAIGDARAAADPMALADRYKSNLKTMRSEDDVLRFMSTTVAPNFGLEGALIAFGEGIAGGTYTKKIQQLINMPRMKWNANWGMLGRYELEDVQRIVNKNVQTPVTSRISGAMTNIGYGLSAIALLNEVIDAANGKDEAKLSAIAAGYNLMRDVAMAEYGTPKLALAMAGVAFIDYALNQYIAYVMGTHEQVWWDAYMAYMEAKYPSPLEFAMLAHAQGADAVDQRLTEFWNAAEENAVEYYTKGKSLPVSFRNVSGKFLDDYRKGFAARYYRDYLRETILTYNRLMAEKAQAELLTRTEAAGQVVTLEAKELALLKKVFESGILDAPDPETQVADETEKEPAGDSLQDSDLRALAANAEAVAGDVQSQCSAADAGFGAGQAALQNAAQELTKLEAAAPPAGQSPQDLKTLLSRSRQFAADANQALQALGDARGNAHQAALTLCEKTHTLRRGPVDDANRTYQNMRSELSVVSQHVQAAQSAAQRAETAARNAADAVRAARQASTPTSTMLDPAAAEAQITLARQRFNEASELMDAARASRATLTTMKNQAAAAAADGQGAGTLVRAQAALQRAESCIAELDVRQPEIQQGIQSVEARYAAINSVIGQSAGGVADPDLLQRIEAASSDAQASADTAGLFADALSDIAQQSRQCLQLAESIIRERERSDEQGHQEALAALDRCDVDGYHGARGQVSAEQGRRLDERFQDFLQDRQLVETALSSAESARKDCNYAVARHEINSALFTARCTDDRQRLNQMLADLDYQAERSQYADQLLSDASQRQGEDALRIIREAEQWAQCPQQRQRIAQLMAQIERREQAQAALDGIQCPPNSEAYWDQTQQQPRCRCMQGYDYDQGRGACVRPGATAGRGEVQCPPNAEAYWDPNYQQQRCRCYQGYQYDQNRGACVQSVAGVPGSTDFEQLLQGMMGAIEAMQNPNAAGTPSPRAGSTPRFPEQTIRGWWRGSCSYASDVGGQFALRLASNGVVKGSFGGDDSGPIQGQIQGTGEMRAGAGSSGECTWTGQFRQDSRGRISGAGRWACQDSCRGNWGQ